VDEVNPECMQTPEEIEWFWERIRGKSSLLEIGSYGGGSLYRWSQVLSPGAKLRSIDIAVSDSLLKVILKLRELGFDADCLSADSKSSEAIAWAKQSSPYDVIFIDGDHSYEGVKADWENYRDMGNLIGFHDIHGGAWGCIHLWSEIKTPTSDEHLVSNGIGVIYKS
jgi:predicted O-methyltransferase YrrM